MKLYTALLGMGIMTVCIASEITKEKRQSDLSKIVLYKTVKTVSYYSPIMWMTLFLKEFKKGMQGQKWNWTLVKKTGLQGARGATPPTAAFSMVLGFYASMYHWIKEDLRRR